MNFFILVGGSSRTIGDLIKPQKSLKKARKKGEKRAQDRPPGGGWGSLEA